MKIHSKLFITASANYKKHFWSKKRIQTLVQAGALYTWEYEQITGEKT